MLSDSQKKAIDVAVGAKSEDRSVSKAVAGVSALADISIVSTADGSDTITTQALANDLKAKINEMLNAIKNA